jgi:Flp pilus assembly protein TadG
MRRRTEINNNLGLAFIRQLGSLERIQHGQIRMTRGSAKAIFRALGEFLPGLSRHNQGNVAITFALACIPVILSVGVAIDFSFANRISTKLNALADAAALAAVNNQAMSLSPSAAKTAAKNMFNAQTAGISRIDSVKVKVKVSESGGTRTAVVSYTALVQNSIMALAGIDTLTLTGQSTAASGIPTYIDFYLLLDNTPSMGVGATPSDVSSMVNNTSDQCAFACHDVSDSNNYYNLAKKLGVTMRIDVVRSATQQLMDTAKSSEEVTDQYRAAIYTFGSSATNAGLTAITNLTSNLSSAKSDAEKIDLMSVTGQNQFNDQDTNYDNILAAINNAIATPGDGSSSAAPQKLLFFVSDGVADESNPISCSQPTTGSRCQEPLNVALCTAMKDRGIKIAVLYTTYLALPTNAWYNTWIAPFNPGPYGPSINSKIAANMQSCASPGLYFEVSPTDGIAEAMTALFEKAVQQARLTK